MRRQHWYCVKGITPRSQAILPKTMTVTVPACKASELAVLAKKTEGMCVSAPHPKRIQWISGQRGHGIPEQKTSGV